jgi:hypothetical protein
MRSPQPDLHRPLRAFHNSSSYSAIASIDPISTTSPRDGATMIRTTYPLRSLPQYPHVSRTESLGIIWQGAAL